MSEDNLIANLKDGIVPDVAETVRESAFAAAVKSIMDYPAYVPESENEDILIKGRWLERGGSAWWISTAGTGKSIASVQTAFCWGAGLPFAGLTPHRPLKTWIFQSEDSPSRIAIDREDIISHLKEERPDVDWANVGKRQVLFVKLPGVVGSAFIKALDELLDEAAKCEMLPDVVQLNPFMAFVGGPITDGNYVTPFLRGGEINGEHTDGLQVILERHRVAALIFHHTPKPPSNEKEVNDWLKSSFPEYKGAGSADITNWGRSFVTMMKIPKHPYRARLVAGKNGNGIGWTEYDGIRCRYLGWSDAQGIDGGRRHAWRELTEDELDEIVNDGKHPNDADKARRCAERTVEWLKANHTFIRATEMLHDPGAYHGLLLTRDERRLAWNYIKGHTNEFRLSSYDGYIGFADGMESAKLQIRQRAEMAKLAGENV